ncbi:MAG: choice-of-anchor Q domain-containing protein [Caldilineaceae bacterium]
MTSQCSVDYSVPAQPAWPLACRLLFLFVMLGVGAAFTPVSKVYAYSGSTLNAQSAQQATTPPIVPSSLITPTEQQEYIGLGNALAVDGNWLFAGAPAWDGTAGTNQQGAVYLFARGQANPEEWSQAALVTAPDGKAEDYFGVALAIGNDILAVGAPLVDLNHQADQGAVYIFGRNASDASQWDFQQKLVASTGAAGDHFGSALAIAGNRLVIGAAGKAYLFGPDSNTPGGWVEVKHLLPQAAPPPGFGAAVAMQGEFILVGAPHTENGGIGAAYLFAQNAGGANGWGEVKKFMPPADPPYISFGSAVLLAGDQAMVGAPYPRAVHIYGRNQGGADTWGAVQTLAPDLPITFRSRDFGRTLAMSDGRLLVNAYAEVYVFTPDQAQAGLWQPVNKLVLTDSSQFSTGLAVQGNEAFVGADEFWHSGVYLFALSRAAAPTIGFATTTYQVSEGAGVAAIEVALDRPNPYPAVSVDYRTTNAGVGQATIGADYTPVTGTLVIPQNAITGVFTIPITNDTLLERPEAVSLSLSNVVNAVPGTLYASLLIVDDDMEVCGYVVADEVSFNRTLRCINAAANVPNGRYTIEVTADITFTQPSTLIFNENADQIVINGNGHMIDAQGNGRVLNIFLSRVTVHNLTLRGGRAPVAGDAYDSGGAIQLLGSHGDGACSLTVSDSILEENEAVAGGAIVNLCDGSVITITNSILRNNHAERGGAIYIPTAEELFSELIIRHSQVLDNRADVQGGGLFLRGGDAGSNATISDSTFAGNRVTNGPGGGITVLTNNEAAVTNLTLTNVAIIANEASAGGGLQVFSRGSTIVTVGNTTISGNRALSETGGGLLIQGVVEFDSTNVRLINSTVANNAATTDGGGIYKQDGLLTLANTLVVSNTANGAGGGDCQLNASPGFPNHIVSAGHNLDSDGSCLTPEVRQPSDIPNGDANLGPLANNGGSTLTHALLAGSQAIDNGDDALCAAAPINGRDQRGVSRPQGAHCDIGAYEAIIATTSVQLFASSRSSGRAGEIYFRDEDILAYSFATHLWQTLFDGSDVGVTKDVNAFAFRSDGGLLLSFNGPTVVPGLGAVDDSDIILFIPTQLGPDTAGSFAWYLRGADVGLTSDGEDIDAIGFTADGQLVISTIGDFSTPTASGHDEDLFQLDNATFGNPTSGEWRLFFDGSSAGLANEDVNGFWLDPATHERYLTVKDSFAFDDVQVDSDDIFVCTPTGNDSGGATTCSYRLFWDSDVHDYGSEDLDSFALGPLPATFTTAGQSRNIAPLTPAEAAADDDVDDLDVEETNSAPALSNHLYLPLVEQ